MMTFSAGSRRQGFEQFFEGIGFCPGLDLGGLIGQVEQAAAIYFIRGPVCQRTQGRLGRLRAAADFSLQG